MKWDILGLFLGVVFCAHPCLAQPLMASDQRLVVGRLPCARPQNPRAYGIRQLMWELMKRTSIEAEMESVQVDPGGPDLFKTPFLVWACEGPVAALDAKALTNLKHFLVLGGFLWIDDPAAKPGGDFDRSVRQTVSRLVEGKTLSELRLNHVLFKSFFLVERAAGRVLSAPLAGLDVGGRVAVVYTANDVLGAVSKDLYGNWENVCLPGGEQQREMSFRLGINIVCYALCLDYKNDRVHLPFILRRRRV